MAIGYMVDMHMVTKCDTGRIARLYDRQRWRRMSKRHLMEEPLCRFHNQQGEVVAATVVDHITPHKGDINLFFDDTNLQSLCKPCHDAVKQHIELHGYDKTIGEDGLPTDKNHPIYTGDRA